MTWPGYPSEKEGRGPCEAVREKRDEIDLTGWEAWPAFASECKYRGHEPGRDSRFTICSFYAGSIHSVKSSTTDNAARAGPLTRLLFPSTVSAEEDCSS
jgi:hypothetical protein